MSAKGRDHGGNIDAARKQYGGARADWLDLSTGINPVPYPLPDFLPSDWGELPDATAMDRLLAAARQFWNVPDDADILAAPGASALIARIPYLAPVGRVAIRKRTYNEHRSAFVNAGWEVTESNADVRVVVHPNNPDGQMFSPDTPLTTKLLVIDESFCDVTPEQSHIDLSVNANTLILKSFGKFWGLAGARLGFAIGPRPLIGHLRELLGPWPVSGPVLRIGTTALSDLAWANDTRNRLANDANRLDGILKQTKIGLKGGTSLFRLYQTQAAGRFHQHLAAQHILTRVFPYDETWIRLGLPGCENSWQRLQTALESWT